MKAEAAGKTGELLCVSVVPARTFTSLGLDLENCHGRDVRPVRQNYWLNRKNFFVPETGLVTAFCPLTTTGPGETALQTAGETRFVVDCKVNPGALVGHVKITLASERIIVSCGVVTDKDLKL